MPRGRPKKDVEQEEIEESNISEVIANELQRWCSIPGCRPKFHLEESQKIVQILKSNNFLREGV